MCVTFKNKTTGMTVIVTDVYLAGSVFEPPLLVIHCHYDSSTWRVTISRSNFTVITMEIADEICHTIPCCTWAMFNTHTNYS